MKTRIEVPRMFEYKPLRNSCLVLALAFVLAPVIPAAVEAASAPAAKDAVAAVPISQPVDTANNQEIERPRIQLAILLDTSNSMDGLIGQTRNQLWQIVNQFTGARQDGVAPILEIALLEYGNSGNPVASGYVRQINGFTRELDAVSQGLFALTTNGGDEYCGYVIENALQGLQWSRSDRDIRMIFIAGNESFDQGPVRYRDAIKMARQYGISVNTIHAGTHAEAVVDGWQVAAELSGGDYLSIDADQQVVHIEAPQDARIAELNLRLNQTYLPYGEQGADKAQRQVEQDQMSSEISAGLLSKRVLSKVSSFYGNADWDMVDAFREGEVAEQQLQEMEESSLPEPMQGLSAQQRVDYLQKKQQERDSIQQEIVTLSESRAIYVAQKKNEQALAAPSVSDALTEAIRRQAQQKNFDFGE